MVLRHSSARRRVVICYVKLNSVKFPRFNFTVANRGMLTLMNAETQARGCIRASRHGTEARGSGREVERSGGRVLTATWRAAAGLASMHRALQCTRLELLHARAPGPSAASHGRGPGWPEFLAALPGGARAGEDWRESPRWPADLADRARGGCTGHRRSRQGNAVINGHWNARWRLMRTLRGLMLDPPGRNVIRGQVRS